MAGSSRAKEFGWRCQVCGKSLTAKPLAGKVIVHAAANGGLCPGSGKAAANPALQRGPKKSKAARGKMATPADTSKRNSSSQTQKSVATERGRPEMLPVKKATGAPPVSKSRINIEDRWWFLQDNPHQDLETDAAWRRVRLGPSQGTGKRR